MFDPTCSAAQPDMPAFLAGHTTRSSAEIRQIKGTVAENWFGEVATVHFSWQPIDLVTAAPVGSPIPIGDGVRTADLPPSWPQPVPSEWTLDWDTTLLPRWPRLHHRRGRELRWRDHDQRQQGVSMQCPTVHPERRSHLRGGCDPGAGLRRHLADRPGVAVGAPADASLAATPTAWSSGIPTRSRACSRTPIRRSRAAPSRSSPPGRSATSRCRGITAGTGSAS